jgi:hypothetical protein
MVGDKFMQENFNIESIWNEYLSHILHDLFNPQIMVIEPVFRLLPRVQGLKKLSREKDSIVSPSMSPNLTHDLNTRYGKQTDDTRAGANTPTFSPDEKQSKEKDLASNNTTEAGNENPNLDRAKALMLPSGIKTDLCMSIFGTEYSPHLPRFNCLPLVLHIPSLWFV